MAKLINNWSKDLTIFTNGKATLTKEQLLKLRGHGISIIEQEIDQLTHTSGQINRVVFKDSTSKDIIALYARPKFEQHCQISQQLGCELTEQNYLKIDAFQKTTEQGIFACGDNTSMMRGISYAIAMGGVAGGMTNREIIEEEF